jgi:hypothetical protein
LVCDTNHIGITAKKSSIPQLTQLLHVSEATMRRKLHAEASFTIDEVYILQQQFGFSIDALAPHAPTDKKLFAIKEFALLDNPIATTDNYIQTAKSTLISGEAEKDRTRIMNYYRAEIDRVIGHL